MPTYEYRCAEGHTFEKFQRMTEPPLDTCPECGAAAERLLSAGAGLLFKGSGFYITDYRSDAYRKAAAADGGKPAEGASEKSAGKPAEGAGGTTSSGGSDAGGAGSDKPKGTGKGGTGGGTAGA